MISIATNAPAAKPHAVHLTVAAIAGLALLAAAATLSLPKSLSSPTSAEELLFAGGYAVLFLVSQRMGFLLHWRGHATRVSIEEFALVGGLVLLPPVLLVVTVTAAAIIHQVVTRRPPLKAAFNIGQYTLAASVATLAYTGLVALGVAPLWASIVGPFAFAGISQGSTAFLFSRLEGTTFASVFRGRFLQWTVITAVIGASLGLGALALWQLSPLALLAIVPVFLLLARFGRLTEWAEEEVRVHKALAEASTRVASTGDFDASAQGILKTCADIFDAGEVTMRLPAANGERTWAWSHPQGASAHGMRVVIPTATGLPGEITVYPRPASRAYGARDRHLLTIVAGSTASAATGSRTLLELKETNQRLSNANRELEEFTLWTTHDMREPLRSVGQLAQILHADMDMLSDDEARDLAKRIERGADTLKSRIKALHEFSLIVQEDGAYAPVDTQDLFDEAQEGLAARITERHALVMTRGDALPIVRGQSARLAKVFCNLIENALKYNDKPEPTVTIAVEEHKAEWEFVVKDNGPGIEPAFRERAFQLFQRGANVEPGSGSGAGLAIVKRIVEQHGGHIWIADSKSGAEFRFTLPKAAAAQVALVPT